LKAPTLFDVSVPKRSPSAEIDPLACVTAVAAAVCRARRSTVALGARVKAGVVFVVVLDDTVGTCPTNIGVVLVVAIVAACATWANTSATAAARVAVESWRIEFSWMILSEENSLQYACRSD
jgi:hypothetical protein